LSDREETLQTAVLTLFEKVRQLGEQLIAFGVDVQMCDELDVYQSFVRELVMNHLAYQDKRDKSNLRYRFTDFELVFHGSHEFSEQILKYGLKMSGETLSNGQVVSRHLKRFGEGIYTAEQPQVAAAYTQKPPRKPSPDVPARIFVVLLNKGLRAKAKAELDEEVHTAAHMMNGRFPIRLEAWMLHSLCR
jgi:hypothetical protein